MMASAKKEKATTLKRAFGRRIRRLRQTRAMTQAELATRAGVHPTYLAGIERSIPPCHPER